MNARIALLLATITLLSGLTPIAAHEAAVEFPPLSLAFARFGTAGVLLYLTSRVRGLGWSFTRADLPSLFWLGALCVPINQAGFLFGIRLASASHAAIAYALVPVFIYWFSIALGRATFAARLLIATTLAFAGAGVVAMSARPAGAEAELSASFLAGDGLLLTAVASWALFSVYSQPVVKRHGEVLTLAAVFLAGALLQLPLVAADLLFFDLRHFDLATVTWRGAGGFFYITVFTAYLNYLLWYLVIARFDMTRSAVVTNAAFLVTVALEWFFLGQSVTWWVAPGAAMLLAGIVLARP